MFKTWWCLFLFHNKSFTCARFAVSYCPALPDNSKMVTFLQALGIDWPTAPTSWSNEAREEKIFEALENSSYREKETERGRRTSGGEGSSAEEGEIEGALRVNLKRVFQEEGLLGYDPSIGTCTGAAKTELVDNDIKSKEYIGFFFYFIRSQSSVVL